MFIFYLFIYFFKFFFLGGAFWMNKVVIIINLIGLFSIWLSLFFGTIIRNTVSVKQFLFLLDKNKWNFMHATCSRIWSIYSIDAHKELPLLEERLGYLAVKTLKLSISKWKKTPISCHLFKSKHIWHEERLISNGRF